MIRLGLLAGRLVLNEFAWQRSIQLIGPAGGQRVSIKSFVQSIAPDVTESIADSIAENRPGEETTKWMDQS